MPLPLNHRAKRVSIALSRPRAVAAYAVPLALNIEMSGGSPTLTLVPVSVSPFKNVRRDSLTRLVMKLDMAPPGVMLCDQFENSLERTIEIISSLKRNCEFLKSSDT